jgi:pilus assembly protein Flp/PilA
MRSLGWFVADFLRREDGPTAVEYAIMMAFIIVVCVSAASALGASTSSSFAKDTLNKAAGGS